MFQNDGITDNPNETIVNLTNYSLSSDELEVLKLRLRYGLATRPNQLEIMAVAEDVWRQISRLDTLILFLILFMHAVTNINNIPRHLFQEGHQVVSFDVNRESLFTNVPLGRTVNILF